MITLFGQLRPLQGGNLARVANQKDVDHKLGSYRRTVECALTITLFPLDREYNGELRQRLSVASIKRIDFVEESRRMIALLAAPSA